MNKKSVAVSQFERLIKVNRFLSVLIIGLVFILAIAVKNNNKPPIVIRESTRGAEILENYISDSAVNEHSVNLFIQTFINKLNFYDHWAIDTIHEPLNMMNSPLRKKFVSEIVTKKLVETIKSQKVATKTTIEEMKFEQIGDAIEVMVIYRRERKNYEGEPLSDMIVRVDMILDILPERSQKYPWGLWVSEYKRAVLS